MKGIYVLTISIRKNLSLEIGALGKIKFTRDTYAYVGSAQNNLEKRIERHLKKKKQKFWHIDYLLGNVNVKVLRVHLKETEKLEECKIARGISMWSIPMKGFGASDCKCLSHLFKIKNLEVLNRFVQKMQMQPLPIEEEHS